MRTENNILNDLKNTFRTGGMTIKLIFINVMVFILIGVIEVLAKIIGGTAGSFLMDAVLAIFSLSTSFKAFIFKPWGLFTSIFTHFGIIHLLFNMVFLYSVGRIFEQYFSAKRLLYTYLLGGLAGGLLEVVSHLFLPGFDGGIVIGASGAVMAVLVATAFYQPQLTVSVWGLFNMRLIFLALIFILFNLYSAGMGVQDGTAYFAHLGGALLGYISVKNPFSANNIINRGIRVGDNIALFFKQKTKKTKQQQYTNARFKTDEEYNKEAKQRQEKIDKILDKISKSGYESLTKEEKEFLFRQSNTK
ncbi:MAG: rhomboid family intramembrane serine protease [Crocinitomicaceae bacterium]|nr:rhomboid family intramembrane serine protease [Crocinitomicaceae bacterium]